MVRPSVLQVNFSCKPGSCAVGEGVSRVSRSPSCPVKHGYFEITALALAFASSYISA